jgi:hypothetical protein
MAESTLTIVFRGLMVFHKTVAQPSIFEVGLLSPPSQHGHQLHVPRINTYKNGVLDSVTPIGEVHPRERTWQLKVDGPLGGVSTDEQGEFKRTTETHPRDYRWLIDLEDQEFHESHAGNIQTRLLIPLLRIETGRFYTRLQSIEMNRRQGSGDVTDFGMVSAAVGCDIRLTGTKWKLVVEGASTPKFIFDVDPTGNTFYEIANTPPDTHVPAQDEDHFQHYYEIFNPQIPANMKYKFSPKRASMAVMGPSPALCGGVRLGKRMGNL